MSARDDQLALLRTATQKLAESAEVQIAGLLQDGFTHMVDELALQFDDYYRSVRHWVADAQLAAALVLLDEALEEMSSPGVEALWSFDALRAAPEWQRIRDLADATLACHWTVHPADREQ